MWKPNFLNQPEEKEEDLAEQIFVGLDKYEGDLLLTAKRAQEWVKAFQKAKDKQDFLINWNSNTSKVRETLFDSQSQDGEISDEGVFIYRVLKKLNAINPAGNHKSLEKATDVISDPERFLEVAQNVWANMRAGEFQGGNFFLKINKDNIADWPVQLPESSQRRLLEMLSIASRKNTEGTTMKKLPIKAGYALRLLADSEEFSKASKDRQNELFTQSLQRYVPTALHGDLGLSRDPGYQGQAPVQDTKAKS